MSDNPSSKRSAPEEWNTKPAENVEPKRETDLGSKRTSQLEHATRDFAAVLMNDKGSELCAASGLPFDTVKQKPH